MDGLDPEDCYGGHIVTTNLVYVLCNRDFIQVQMVMLIITSAPCLSFVQLNS